MIKYKRFLSVITSTQFYKKFSFHKSELIFYKRVINIFYCPFLKPRKKTFF